MATTTVLPDTPRAPAPSYRAVVGDQHAVGSTVGQTLDGEVLDTAAPSELASISHPTADPLP